MADDPLRSGIADRLHDELLPLLAVARQDALEGGEPLQLVAVLDEAIGVARRLLVAEHPPAAEHQALEDAIDAVARPVCARAKLGLEVDVAFDGRKLSQEQQTVVLVGVRELVQNVAAHANASHVIVRGRRRPGGWRVEVQDDGRGIDPDLAAQRRKDGHLGLRRLRSTLKAAGGRLIIDSGLSGTRAAVLLTAPDGVEP